MVDYYDYGSNCPNGGGCCLLCPNAHPGCLCYECNCKSCEWYEPELAGNSPCMKVKELLEERKEEWIRQKKMEQEIKNKIYRLKIKNNNLDESCSRTAEEKCKNVVQTFTCQKCGIDFPIKSDEEFPIIVGEFPICQTCLEENADK